MTAIIHIGMTVRRTISVDPAGNSSCVSAPEIEQWIAWHLPRVQLHHCLYASCRGYGPEAWYPGITWEPASNTGSQSRLTKVESTFL